MEFFRPQTPSLVLFLWCFLAICCWESAAQHTREDRRQNGHNDWPWDNPQTKGSKTVGTVLTSSTTRPCLRATRWLADGLEGRQFDPQSSQKDLHAEVSLSKMLNPELCLIEQQSAEWVWLGECENCTVKLFVWSSQTRKVLYKIQIHPFTQTPLC